MVKLNIKNLHKAVISQLKISPWKDSKIGHPVYIS